MKKKKTISKLVAAAAISAATMAPGFAQTNLGSSCGCPPVTGRPTVLLSTLATNGGASDGDLAAKNTILTCNKTWILDKKIYVPNGSTLSIQPGTVIKGRIYSTPDSATALVVSRGGKIFADGTCDCQIVMTAEGDPMDGSFPISTPTANKWGGLVIAGQASNNLTLTKNGPFQPGVGDGKLCVADGLGTFEGFKSSDFRDQFGVNLTTPQAGYNTTFDDDDNSGILRYLSVRFAGAILQVGGEINGISLGSVGRGTTIDHVEVIAAADDNMEFFGGTVNVKNAAFMFGNDDMFDWDDGYSGKVQNVFAIKSSSNDTLTASTKDADNGFEMDADDQQSGNGSNVPIGTIAVGGYRSHPTIYNCTFIGNNKIKETSDNTGMAAIMAKELTEGEIYNCVFANFAVGLNLWKGNLADHSEGTRGATQSSAGHTVTDSYDNWIAGDLKVKNNTFVNCRGTLALDVTKTGSYFQNPAAHAPSASDLTKFSGDGNVTAASIPGFVYNWTLNPANPVSGTTVQYDPTPNPSLLTSIVAPADGFFSAENYRGAFESGKPSWLAGWTYGMLCQFQGGVVPCPTDLNGDGKTDNVDFLQMLGQYNQSCH